MLDIFIIKRLFIPLLRWCDCGKEREREGEWKVIEKSRHAAKNSSLLNDVLVTFHVFFFFVNIVDYNDDNVVDDDGDTAS